MTNDRLLDLIRKYLDPAPRFTGGSNVQVKCPFHKSGEERRPSFSINLAKGVCQCFTCGYAAPIKKMFKDLRVPDALVDRALEGIKFEAYEKDDVKQFRRNRFISPFIIPDWTLGAFHKCPVPLVEAGFDEGLLEDYEVGVDRHNNRITWPVRDYYGNLAGIVGGRLYPDQEPKYKAYKAMDLKPTLKDFLPHGYDFQNHDYLWNMNRLENEDLTRPVVVVEGFKAALWVIQCGYEACAIQGTILSKLQMDTLLRLGRPVHLFLDNNSPGKEGTYKNLKRLMRVLPVKVIDYESDEPSLQPDDLTPDQVQKVIEQPLHIGEWTRRNGNVARRIQRAQRKRKASQETSRR